MDRAKHTRLKPKSLAKTRHSSKKKDKKNISASRKLPSFNKTGSVLYSPDVLFHFDADGG